MRIRKKWIAGIAVLACAAAVICGIVLKKTKPAVAADENPIQWTKVADEGKDFTVHDRWLYRYGANDGWVYKNFDAGTYTGNTATFGGTDPAPNIVKGVYSLTIPDEYWTKVAEENGSFTATTRMLYRFGAKGKYYYKILDAGTYTGTSAQFGGDPIPGTVKAVYALNIPDKYWVKAAHESVSFEGDTDLYRYGANGKWSYALLDKGTHVGKNGGEFGPDPIGGTEKDVYYLNLDLQYKFVGWNTKPDGTGKMFQGGDDIGKMTKDNPEVKDYLDKDGNLDLYAIWELK